MSKTADITTKGKIIGGSVYSMLIELYFLNICRISNVTVADIPGISAGPVR